jgi:hypothetical protein
MRQNFIRVNIKYNQQILHATNKRLILRIDEGLLQISEKDNPI